MSDFNISMILRLVDKVTAPAQPVLRTMRQVQDTVGTTGDAAMRVSQNIDRAVERQRKIVTSEALKLGGIGAALAGSLKPAIDFESAMASVKKVISFDDDTGLKLLGNDLLDLTNRIPMTAGALTEIAAAAGRAGLINDALPDDEKRRSLVAFAELAAQMGTAFDISAEAAGSAMAHWRSVLGMSEDDTLVYADALNALANSMATSEVQLVEITRRVGSLGELAGLSNLDFLALAASISAAGAAPEVAATGLKNFTNALTQGLSMTDGRADAFRQLGFDAETLAERMQVDAKGAILDVLDALAEVPKARQSAMLSELFGEEAKDAIAPLLTNLEGLRVAFDKVSDPNAFQGAMLAEFQAQMATTETQLKLTMNRISEVAIILGTVFLPALQDALSAVRDFLKPLADWAAANPELVRQIGMVALGFLGLRVGIFAARVAFVGVFGPAGEIIKGLGFAARAFGRFSPWANTVKGVGVLRTGVLSVFGSSGVIASGIARVTRLARVLTLWGHLSAETTLLGRVFWGVFGPSGMVARGLSLTSRLARVLNPWRNLSAATTLFGNVYWAVFGPGGLMVRGLALVWRAALWLNPWGRMVAGLRVLSTAFGAVFGSGGMMIRGLSLLWRAVRVLSPWGLLITGLVLLARTIYRHWDEIAAYFNDKFAAVRAAFQDGLLNGVVAILREFHPVVLLRDALAGLAGVAWDAIQDMAARLHEALSGIPLYDAGLAMIQRLWDGAGARVSEMIGNLRDRVLGWLPSFDGLTSDGAAMIQSLWSGAEPMSDEMAAAIRRGLLAMVPGVALYDQGLAMIQSLWDGAGARLAEMTAGLQGLVLGWMPSFDGLYDDGAAMIQSLWDGATSVLGQMVAAISAKIKEMVPDWLLKAWSFVSGDEVALDAAGAAEPQGLPPIVSAAPLTAQGARITNTTTIGDINVHPAPGMNETDLARLTAQYVREASTPSSTSQPLHDGFDFGAAP